MTSYRYLRVKLAVEVEPGVFEHATCLMRQGDAEGLYVAAEALSHEINGRLRGRYVLSWARRAKWTTGRQT